MTNTPPEDPKPRKPASSDATPITGMETDAQKGAAVKIAPHIGPMLHRELQEQGDLMSAAGERESIAALVADRDEMTVYLKVEALLAEKEAAEARVSQLQQERDEYWADLCEVKAGTGVVPQALYDEAMKRAGAAEREREAIRRAVEATKEYLRKAMRPQNIAAAASETTWDRGRRSGLQEAVNAINCELARAEDVAPPVGSTPRESDPSEPSAVSAEAIRSLVTHWTKRREAIRRADTPRSVEYLDGLEDATGDCIDDLDALLSGVRPQQTTKDADDLPVVNSPSSTNQPPELGEQ